MSKAKEWSVNVSGKINQISLKSSQWTGKRQIELNGKPVEIPKKPFQAFTGIDFPIKIGDADVRLVLIGNKADIAINGKYLNSGKPYIPLKGIPWWTWIFVIACLAVPIIASGGAFPAVLAVLGIIWCIRVAISPDLKTPIKVICCLGVTGLVYGLFWILITLVVT
jgi:hypothetical protein